MAPGQRQRAPEQRQGAPEQGWTIRGTTEASIVIDPVNLFIDTVNLFTAL